ncbi:Transcription factor IIIC subunit 5 [Trypanosoma melophagium]|uniref:Transcription factor IIIC subunit 5 n=1 Tax=Trypanosoma melophagium TaxID=715481 RepID=UPI003519EA35|nr:Transcription factor IIIC subunit 5 [Trypanosoma melophagium]
MANIPPYRCFVSVELPFCLPVTSSSSSTYSSRGEMRDSDRRMVEAFVPPSFLRPCLDEVHSTEKKENKNMEQDQGQFEHLVENTETGKKQHERNSMKISMVSEYCPNEVFSGWRPLDFDVDSNKSKIVDTTHNITSNVFGKNLTKTIDEEGKRDREEILRESFPSFVPQILMQGFYRNDLLVEVKRTRRMKRLRDPTTGRILEELYLPSDDVRHQQPKPTVVGVVSREVDLVRPADFCFAPFSKDQAISNPAFCSTNFFPPSHFISEKTPFEVECEFNGPFTTKKSALRAGVKCGEETEMPPQREFEAMPTLSVMANDPQIPPPMLAAQRDLLSRLNGGEGEEDCVEVKTVKGLLEERPVWIAQELLDAVLQSGICPRKHINKKVVSCLTYVIKNGPFNRLRVRIGFDPYASRKTASLQRIAVKIARRSELGTLIRDISRAPKINEVMQELLKNKMNKTRELLEAENTENDSSVLLYRPRGSFYERLANLVTGGRLFVALQIADLVEDTVFKNILATVPAAPAPMPIEKRSERTGWIGENGYHRAAAQIMEALSTFIQEEVAPALEKTEGRGGETERKADLFDHFETDSNASMGSARGVPRPQ